MSQEQNQKSQRLALIDALVKKPEVNEVYFNGKVVQLDGYSFRGCRFDNCQLHIASSNFEMHRCVIDTSTVITYYGEIIKLLRLFNSRYENVYRHLPFFAPTRHNDGTISIVT